MSRRLVLLLLCVFATAAHAQPTTIAWRPPAGCTDGQGISFDAATNRWVCETFGAGFSTSNVIPKGDGSGLVASSWTDDGTTTATSAILDVNNDLAKFGSSGDGLVYIYGDIIGAGFASDTDGVDLAFNYGGFGGGNTRYRDAVFYDGRNAVVLTITGSTKDATFASTATVTGLLTATAGVTTPANLTTTGTGALVVAGNGSVAGNFTSGDGAGDVFDHNGDIAKFGSSQDGYTYIKNERYNFGYGIDADMDGYISWEGYNAGTTRFRNVIFGDGKQAIACTLTGSTKVLNCVGGLQENGTAVLSGSITDNTIPKGSGGNLTNSSLIDDGGGGVYQVQVGGVSGFYFGDTTTGASDTGFRIATWNDNNVYLSTKVGNGGSLIFGVGHNTETWDARTWLTVTGSNGNAAFGAAGSFTGNLSTDANLTAGTGLTVTTGTADLDAATTLVGDVRGTVLEIGSVSGTLNDWAPTGHATATHFAITPNTTGTTLNGLSGGAGGRIVVLTNMATTAGHDISVNHENAGSSAANRFDMVNSQAWNVQIGQSATFIYNGASSRWVHIGTRTFPSLFSTTIQTSGVATLASVSTSTINSTDASVATFQGRIGVTGADPTLSSCGTSPTIVGNDAAGIVTVGTGTATACTVTFVNTYTDEPVCVLTGDYNSGDPFYFSAKSATAFTFTTSAGGNFAGAKVNYICFKR